MSSPDLEGRAITQAVIDSFKDTPDPRLKEIMVSLTRHMHAFVRETGLSFDEWMAGVQFLTRTGQICDGNRQEFILLSDVLGVSMLVDAIAHRDAQGATETTVLGPFFTANAPVLPDGADLARGAPGEPLFVEAVFRSTDGGPLAGATVDVWQSDDDGFYDVQKPDHYKQATLRGRLVADGEGRVRFWSILPTAYPIPDDGPVGGLLAATGRHPWRPAHLHFMIAAPGHDTLVTHLFVRGSDYLDSDAVFGVKPSLICDFAEHPAGPAPDGRGMAGPWRSLSHQFTIKRSASPER